MGVMKHFIVVLLASVAVAQQAQAPKVYPFKPSDVSAIQGINTQLARLQQEERAIAAERQVLQMQADKLFDSACKEVGGEKCQATLNDPDPSKWSFTIATPPPTVAKK